MSRPDHEHDWLCSLPWENRVVRLFEMLARLVGETGCCDCQLEPWNRPGRRSRWVAAGSPRHERIAVAERLRGEASHRADVVRDLTVGLLALRARRRR